MGEARFWDWKGLQQTRGLQYCFLFVTQVVHEQTKEVTVSCSLGHQTLWKVHESVFRQQGGQPKVSHGALQ